MFKSTGNNFGAPEISFKDYQSEHKIILNAFFDYDSTNEVYKKARQLEIYVPDLSISKSAVAGCFFAATTEEGALGTVVKTWIKNRNTIVIEKLTAWDECPRHRIYICTMYGLRGFRGIPFEPLKRRSLSLQQSDSIGSPSDQTYYKTDDWIFLNFSLGDLGFYARSKTCFLSNYADLPDDIDAVLPYVNGMHSSFFPGMNIMPVQMKESQILIADMPQSMSSGTGWDSMFYAFIVRDKDKTPDVPGRLRWTAEALMAAGYSRGSDVDIEVSGIPSMVSAQMISSFYGESSHAYEIEDAPEAMDWFEAFFIGTHLTGKCLTLQLAHLKFDSKDGKRNFTITASAGGSALTFKLFDTSAAMSINF